MSFGTGSTEWRIICETDWEVMEWKDTTPTTCPINAGHTLVSVSTFAIEQEVFRVNYLSTIASSTYHRVAMFHYDTDRLGTMRRMKMLAYCDGTTTNFNIKIYDATNQTILLLTNSTNTQDTTTIDVGIISSPPSGIVILEVQLQKGDGNGNVYFNELLVYSISGTEI